MSQVPARRSIDEIARAAQWSGGIKQGRDWNIVERQLGTVLPDDYKQLMTRFPSGFFRNAINLDNPIDARTDLDRFLREDVWEVIDIIGHPTNGYLAGTGYRTFPGPRGLLPWGNDLQGGMFCWVTDPGDPNQWPVAYNDRDDDGWREHSGGITGVIWEILTHNGDDNILHINLDHELPVFRVPSTYGPGDKWTPHPEYR